MRAFLLLTIAFLLITTQGYAQKDITSKVDIKESDLDLYGSLKYENGTHGIVYKNEIDRKLKVLLISKLGEKVAEVDLDLCELSKNLKKMAGRTSIFASSIHPGFHKKRLKILSNGGNIFIFEVATAKDKKFACKPGDILIRRISSDGQVTAKLYTKSEHQASPLLTAFATPNGVTILTSEESRPMDVKFQNTYSFAHLNLESSTVDKIAMKLPDMDDEKKKTWVFNNWIFAGFHAKNKTAVFYKKTLRCIDPKQKLKEMLSTEKGDYKLIYEFATVSLDGTLIRHFEKETNLPDRSFVAPTGGSALLWQAYQEKYKTETTLNYGGVAGMPSNNGMNNNYRQSRVGIYAQDLGDFGDILFHNGKIYSFGDYSKQAPKEKPKKRQASPSDGFYLHCYTLDGETVFEYNQSPANDSKPTEEVNAILEDPVFKSQRRIMASYSATDGAVLTANNDFSMNPFKKKKAPQVQHGYIIYQIGNDIERKIGNYSKELLETINKLNLPTGEKFIYLVCIGEDLIIANSISDDGSSKSAYVIKNNN